MYFFLNNTTNLFLYSIFEGYLTLNHLAMKLDGQLDYDKDVCPEDCDVCHRCIWSGRLFIPWSKRSTKQRTINNRAIITSGDTNSPSVMPSDAFNITDCELYSIIQHMVSKKISFATITSMNSIQWNNRTLIKILT